MTVRTPGRHKKISPSCSPLGCCQVGPCLVGHLTTPCVHRCGRWLQLWGNMGGALVPVHVAFSLSGSDNRHSGAITHRHSVHDLGPMVGQEHGGGPHCDNQAAVCVINVGYSCNKDMMHLMCCLFFIRAYCGIGMRAEHILGKQNVAADAISHGNLSTLFQVSPQASPLPTAVPHSLHDLLVAQQPDWTSPSWVSLFRRHQNRCYPISNEGDNPLCLCSSPVTERVWQPAR